MWDLAGGTGVWRQTTDEDVIKNLKLEGDSLIVSINFSRIKLVITEIWEQSAKKKSNFRNSSLQFF